MKEKFSVAILGAGNRGCAYGEIMQNEKNAGHYKINAVCDINSEQLKRAKKIFDLPDEALFSDEESFFAVKRADLMVIATYDKYHVRQCIRALEMGYDVLLEKPVSDSREEIEKLLEVQKRTGRTVAVCHELRYGPAYEKIYELIQKGTVGDIFAIDAMERVIYWHFAQAYVRIQSKYNDVAHPVILGKCSHDLDLLYHFAGAECESVSSVGGLTCFRPENAPEGSKEKCIDCPEKEVCPYSAKKIYIDRWEEKGCPEFIWPFNKVSVKIPNTKDDLYEGIKNTHFGKCAFRCGVEKNPHVVDHQLIQMQFKNGITATLKMLMAGGSGRRINIFGTRGEILMDERSSTIEVMRYGEEKEVIGFNTIIERGHAHGGGDERIVEGLYHVLRKECGNRTSLRESAECHLMGIAAEESRLAGGATVKVHKD